MKASLELNMSSSPHSHSQKTLSNMMMTVILACIPGLLVQMYFFGLGVLFQCLLALIAAICAEAFVLKLRKRPVLATIKDNSAILTALLLALSIPPLAPWWVIVIGTLFAIIIVKQLYGGLGFNLFNPAMAGYVLLLISFPVQMTSWLPVNALQQHHLGMLDQLHVIFTGFSDAGFSVNQLRMNIDGITMATPLDTLKTDISKGLTVTESLAGNVFNGFAGKGWFWVNLAFLFGGLYLIKIKVINWHIPIAMLASLAFCAILGPLFSPDIHAGPVFHLVGGATMLGAFFIATDPVSAATTNKGRLIYGALIGLLVYLIRAYGGYPDAVAFSVLLLNLAVPLIDYYTKPRTYGHGEIQ
ncbi:electron transport complex subunit RsxD [Pseudoalteromonas denitrificans]|uniref:Ion-translocating oxidoreductase complex subunit D n=1 Tax=Pseudoalteromonas denitrificans DSM 6059 TaxID=1123010 RepID=A0A1I1IS81_9GAMM|nr:electron transport complex subunit RsxD [Pseudoalteromonas denitrificans]SFC39137.1 electron transport complex protein RnfD [Pseudoalteromonas denitrificans DSM 6059]